MNTDESKIDTKEINTIYHYTNWKAFEGIITNKTLRLSNVSYSNDANEILFGFNQLGLAEILQICAELDNINIHDKNFIHTLINEYVSNNPIFAICFSNNRDDVPQWERYAQDSNGVCIGFNKNNLIKLLENEQYYIDNVFRAVDYYERGDIVKSKINRTSKIISKLRERNHKKEVKEELGEVISYIMMFAKYLKHPSFKLENEIRFALYKNDLEKIKNYLKHDSPTFIKYEADKDRIREFVELDLEHLCQDKQMNFNDLIDEIIIGPKSIMDEELVKRYLTSIGLRTLCEKVKKSTSSIR